MAIARILGCTLDEASDIDPLEELDLTAEQRSLLAEAAAAEYRHAASTILSPYGFTLSCEGEAIRSDELGEDDAYPWDEEAVREELAAIGLPWTVAFAEALSAHNSFTAVPSSDARTARDSAIVRAARAGVSAHRLAEAIGLTDSALERIIAEDLCR